MKLTFDELQNKRLEQIFFACFEEYHGNTPKSIKVTPIVVVEHEGFYVDLRNGNFLKKEELQHMESFSKFYKIGDIKFDLDKKGISMDFDIEPYDEYSKRIKKFY